MTPILVPVTSSNLLAVGYDPAARTLYVAFRGPARAPSHGEYLSLPAVAGPGGGSVITQGDIT